MNRAHCVKKSNYSSVDYAPLFLRTGVADSNLNSDNSMNKYSMSKNNRMNNNIRMQNNHSRVDNKEQHDNTSNYHSCDQQQPIEILSHQIWD